MTAFHPETILATLAMHTPQVEMLTKRLVMKAKPDAMLVEATAMNICSVAMPKRSLAMTSVQPAKPSSWVRLFLYKYASPVQPLV